MAEKTINTRLKLLYKTHAEWEAIKDTFAPLRGEACFELFEDGSVKFKIGDGAKKLSELPYVGGEDVAATQVYEVIPTENQSHVDAITAAVGENALVAGDIAIVKDVISGDKYQYTAYVYNGSAWVAMDGNYNAENVYFDKDLITTSAVGNITLTNGQATIAATGKNLKQVFDTIFVKEKNPSVTQPSVSVSLAGAGAKEVGTKVTPSYTATFNAGKYEFGPATGCSITSWSVTDSNNAEPLSTAAGSFTEITVADDTNYKVTATGNFSEGVIPVTNVGNEYAAGKIAAGSKSATSSAITGYRNSFYGTLTEKGELTSDIIRSLGKSNKALTNGSTFNINVPIGAMRVVIAYPATLQDLSAVLDSNDSSSNIVTSFGQPTTVSVEGANGAEGINYKVYYMDYANPYNTANVYKVTI